MILTAIFNRFRASEFIQFFSDVITICRQYNLRELKIENQVNDFDQSQENLIGSFKQNQKSSFTEVLSQLDDRRDKALVCISKISDGYLNHHNEQKREAARQIVNCIDKYGSRLYDLNYQAETSVLSRLGTDLTENCSKAIDTLYIVDSVEEMITSNTLFNEKFIDRVEESATTDSVSTGEQIKATVEKYRNLCKYIDAHATIAPSEQYSNLISKLNALIGRYNSTMAMRNNSKTEEDVNINVD